MIASFAGARRVWTVSADCPLTDGDYVLCGTHNRPDRAAMQAALSVYSTLGGRGEHTHANTHPERPYTHTCMGVCEHMHVAMYTDTHAHTHTHT